MTQETHLSELEEEMAQAVASEDFETASALRERIDVIRRDQRIMEQPGERTPQAAYFKQREAQKAGPA